MELQFQKIQMTLLNTHLKKRKENRDFRYKNLSNLIGYFEVKIHIDMIDNE